MYEWWRYVASKMLQKLKFLSVWKIRRQKLTKLSSTFQKLISWCFIIIKFFFLKTVETIVIWV